MLWRAAEPLRRASVQRGCRLLPAAEAQASLRGLRSAAVASRPLSGCGAAAPSLLSPWRLPLRSGVRGFCGANAGQRKPLVATRTSNVGKLAGALAAQLREPRGGTGTGAGHPAISAVGPTAAYMALKAVIIAEGYVQDLFAGQCLAVVPSKQAAVKTAHMPDANGILLTVRLVPQRPNLPEEPELYSAQDTNVGQMAGIMAGVLGKQEMVTVGSMGDKAVSNSLKATIITQKYVAESLGDRGCLALIPRFSSFEERGEERMRMLLSCLRLMD
eukprot:TRINITY_DN19805_c0_g1_i2.p1 TRINITY_DN19805_c0_g1~~TRINITY_DN19805_c0_g1_i2.p1  ORF type:complete len:287 (-),score=68.29 TRINITY_DN19805_c0_g1_i2:24-842(-)